MTDAAPLPADYQTLPAADKRELLWQRVLAGEYADGALPVRAPGAVARARLLTVGFNRVSFEHAADELPPGRRKLLHAFGVVGKATLSVDEGRGYTGLLASGATGLIRFSEAAGAGSFTPSLALKLFVDGKPSVNYFAMPSQEGQGRDHNSFARRYSNALPPVKRLDLKLLGRVFTKTAKALRGARLHAVYLPLHDLAGVRANGSAESEPRVPDRLELFPTAAAARSPSPARDWRLEMAELAEGTELFEVRVADSIDSDAVAFGRITLASRLVASRYGDETLFFQHPIGPRSVRNP